MLYILLVIRIICFVALDVLLSMPECCDKLFVIGCVVQCVLFLVNLNNTSQNRAEIALGTILA